MYVFSNEITSFNIFDCFLVNVLKSSCQVQFDLHPVKTVFSLLQKSQMLTLLHDKLEFLSSAVTYIVCCSLSVPVHTSSCLRSSFGWTGCV